MDKRATVLCYVRADESWLFLIAKFPAVRYSSCLNNLFSGRYAFTHFAFYLLSASRERKLRENVGMLVLDRGKLKDREVCMYIVRCQESFANLYLLSAGV